MVGPVNGRASQVLRNKLTELLGLLGAATLGLAAAGASAAAELPDPTRPPLAQRRAGPQVQVAGPIVPVLQSVLVGAGRKPAVIISGQALELGESFDGMKLTRVTETGVVLSGPRGNTSLSLTPSADKLALAPARDTGVVTASTPRRDAAPSAASSMSIQLLDTK